MDQASKAVDAVYRVAVDIIHPITGKIPVDPTMAAGEAVREKANRAITLLKAALDEA